MQRASKLRLTEVSPHLICALCGGYLIDATTIVECLHSFCKTCIVRYLESSKYCPICEVLVHKTRPLQNIRLDHTLQDIVYKLVPGLFKDEMKRRREYYKDSPTIRSAEIRQQQQRHRVIFSADEMFSVSLEFCPDGRVRPLVVKRGRKSKKSQDRRYLLCPAGTTIAHLKKFIRLKFALSESFQVDLFHAKGNLRDNYSLMDVAYIYSWKRDGVFQLYYSIFKEPLKIPQITITEVKEEPALPETKKHNSCFSASSLLGNECCDDSELPHDLSPLELIATVANGLSSLPEGRGQKRNAETAELYDDDTHGSNEIQIQKSIEHAIEMCSNNNQENKYSIEMEESANVHNSDTKQLIVVKLEDTDSTVMGAQNETIPNKSKLNENNKPVVQNERPKKTDTASQCDPRPRKNDMKVSNSSSSHSKPHSKQIKQVKIQNQNSGEINGTKINKDTNVTKTSKDISFTKTVKDDSVHHPSQDLDKKSKVIPEQDKKMVNNLKPADKSHLQDKLLKASPQKQEKNLISQKSEKCSVTQKLNDTHDNIVNQKTSFPQVNGICSANDLEKDTASTAKTNA